MRLKMLPVPTKEIQAKAAATFRNSFPISQSCKLSSHEITEQANKYIWHYPLKFGDLLFEATAGAMFEGIHGRHYLRYGHIFPALLTLTNGTLRGKSVLDIGCNAGFWSIQCQLAGADSVKGYDGNSRNIEQARFILKLTGLDNITYNTVNAYEVGLDSSDLSDITLFLGLLYHLDKPVHGLEKLYSVTKEMAVIDTFLVKTDNSVLVLQEDHPHEQNYSNKIGFTPSVNALVSMLTHVGFREVYFIQNSGEDLPEDYINGNRGTFIALK